MNWLLIILANRHTGTASHESQQESLFPVSLLRLLMPHTEVHGPVTGTDDGKHAKADTELGEIALKNKLFFLRTCLCFQAYHQIYLIKRGGCKRKKDRIAVRMLRSRDPMAGKMMYPSIPTATHRTQNQYHDVLQISVSSVRRRWYICATIMSGPPTKLLT